MVPSTDVLPRRGKVSLVAFGKTRKAHKAPLPGFSGRSSFALKVEAIVRSEEHTSELQSLMRISYAVFCLQKKTGIPCHHLFHAVTIVPIVSSSLPMSNRLH